MTGQVDLVLRGGTVFDGTGGAGREADVAVKDGLIVEVGTVAAAGREEIDARGQIVTPGFVDIHTHYDGQAVWDSHLAPSSWHGVTTAIMGNCGVGFAPCKPGDRERLIELMEGVEDIPAPAMHEGLDWNWLSFADYLGALGRKPRDIDIGALLPHSAVRVYVMGQRATFRENANQADIAEMREIATAAMEAGAFGFSTSRTMSHKTLAGEYIPTLRAQEEELTGIAMGVRAAGRGMLELVSDWNQPDAATEFALARRVVEKTGLPLVFTANQRHDRTEVWKELLALSDQAAADGLHMRPVFPPRPVGILLGLQGTQNPFSGCPSYKKIAHLPVRERVAAMRDPELRRQILSEDPVKESTFPLIHRIGYDWMFPFEEPLNYEPSRENCISRIAAREGRTAPEVAYDLLIADEGSNFILATVVNYAHYNLDPVKEFLAHKNTIMGLGDGGAHVGFISDANFQTFLMTHWARDRADGRIELAEAIRRMTSDTARTCGLDDRGVIAVGKKADLNVIDFDNLRLERPYIVFDLPAGGRRLLQKAVGYTATIKAGEITFRHGEATGALPGKLLRGGPRVAA
ncbi:MAG: amidohydrolase family protein [Acetobacteraceae bacterium]|nr:amidohydrolase family protein [Acetobacteraceae bacterium]